MEWIPILNLYISGGIADTVGQAGDTIYKVLQILAALKVIGEAGLWLAAKTETEADDKFWAAALHYTGRITAWVTDLASANTRKPKRGRW